VTKADHVLARVARENPVMRDSAPSSADQAEAARVLNRVLAEHAPALARPDARSRLAGRVLSTVAVAVSAVVAVIVVLVVGHGHQVPREARPIPAAPVQATSAVRPVLAGTIRVPGGVVDIATTGPVLWVAGFGTVTELDAATGRTIARARTPGVGEDSHLAIGAGGVWVTSGRAGHMVYRLAPRTDRVVARIDVGGPVIGVAVGDGHVWVSRPAHRAGDVIEIDAATNDVVGHPIKVGDGPSQAIDGLGSVWIQNTVSPSTSRLDPGDRAVSTVPLVGGLGIGDGSVWAAADGAVSRFDPHTNKVIADIPIPGAVAIAFGGHSTFVLAGARSRSSAVFAPVKHSAALWQVDSTTNRPVKSPLRLNALQPIAITASRSSVWIADYARATITRFALRHVP
jgi:DNA-binding beta-propeller fold protein YncE